MPGINPTGTNTAANIKAIAITGPDISFIAFLVASIGDIFSKSILCCTASTTIIASSTTIPIASTKANKVRVLMVKPSVLNKINVPIKETGIANNGISVARQFCRKRSTTMTTNNNAINNVFTTSFIET